MKPHTPLFALLLAVSAVLVGGCSQPATVSKNDIRPEAAASYNAGRGVKLTPLSSEFIGLATAEFSGRVPEEAVLRTIEGTFVYVDNGGWMLRTPVKLSARAPGETGIPLSEGLYDGDRIVTRGVRALWLAELHFLRAGQACAHEG